MKIVILTNILTPYRKFFYDNLYEECKKNNDEFHVLVMAKTEPERHWNYEDFSTEYTTLLESKTLSLGGIFIHVNKGLKQVYKKLKPDVVICGGSYLYPSVWQTIKYSRKMGFKILEWSESHLNEKRNYNRIKLFIREKIRKMVIRKFEGFWCAGQFSKEFVFKYANKEAKYIFVPNMVDERKFNSVKKITAQEKINLKLKDNLDLNKRILITPARLIPVKGFMEFFKLYSKCNTSKCQYIIIGDGELKDSIQEFVSKNNLDVKLLGYKNEKEVLDYYAISDGFILPSISDANPLTCVEALWCNLPLLVSTHVGNYPEVVNQGENGYVFDYSDESKAIQKIDKYLNQNDEWFEKAGKISEEIAKQLYDSKNAIPRILEETRIIVRNDK